jgi:hypothetical protein
VTGAIAVAAQERSAMLLAAVVSKVPRGSAYCFLRRVSHPFRAASARLSRIEVVDAVFCVIAFSPVFGFRFCQAKSSMSLTSRRRGMALQWVRVHSYATISNAVLLRSIGSAPPTSPGDRVRPCLLRPIRIRANSPAGICPMSMTRSEKAATS